MRPFRILFFGDVIGSIGRRAVTTALPELRNDFQPDFVIANVENLAHGRGITPSTLEELDRAQIDAYTSGNHVWENPVGLACFTDDRWKQKLIRPANVAPDKRGKGWTIIEKDGVKILLINVMGQLFLKDTMSSPFLSFDRIVSEAGAMDIVLVDHHAETTSEKEALGHYADGRATAVVGTHTHVPTADAKILTAGTAYITDVGRNGGYDTVVGFEKVAAVERFMNPSSRSYDPPDRGTMEVNCVCITVDLESKRAIEIQHIRRIIDK